MKVLTCGKGRLMYHHKRRAFIIDAKRTAIGKFLGSLYEQDAADICAQLIRGAFDESLLGDVQLSIVGNCISAGTGQGVARKIAILSGVPQEAPAYSVNMVCGSGMQAIRNSVREIECGLDIVLCGGFELMSNIPFATHSYLRLGKKFGNFEMVDLMVADGLTDSFSGVHMGVTAENVARKYGVTREDQDAYSFMTLQRAISAVDAHMFDDEIVPVRVRDYRGNEALFDVDEFPNRASTPEKVASLKPTFVKDGTGSVTAASSSGINDGASFMLVASESYCRDHGVQPIAELIADSAVGIDPQLMGLGPYHAVSRLIDGCEGITFADIDYFEINEAFAAQTIASIRLLAERYGAAEEALAQKTNVWGSGIGLGHPLGATGARIVTTLAHVLKMNDARLGVASLCIGGGMGAAVLIRKVEDDEFA